ncbi:MAG TPA: tyrosine-protein phosphatase [Gemmataceae bacterium]|nr:tyrosine-protein phosphatase [Gemmataceae bacterium]
MPEWLRWALGLAITASIIAVPAVHFRALFAHAKRLREVTPERFYRCGQLTATGFREAFQRYGIRTVLNLQDEAPDPLLRETYYDAPSVLESDLCREHGVRYRVLYFDLLPRNRLTSERPAVIDAYLQILDDPDAYPILLHCKAGLHRTGLLTAIYRMEKEGWSKGAALRELRANGFGDSVSNTSNDYVMQLLELYVPGQRRVPASPTVYGVLGCGARARDFSTAPIEGPR